jgi:hypothetical protein
MAISRQSDKGLSPLQVAILAEVLDAYRLREAGAVRGNAWWVDHARLGRPPHVPWRRHRRLSRSESAARSRAKRRLLERGLLATEWAGHVRLTPEGRAAAERLTKDPVPVVNRSPVLVGTSRPIDKSISRQIDGSP